MKFEVFNKATTQEVIELFTKVFSDSEGDTEGRVIGNLVRELITHTAEQELIGCVAIENDCIIAGIFLSRFSVPNGKKAFLLSPVAVSSNFQGKGIGQQLIHYGLEQLKLQQVALVFTYGDPKFYSKTGFEHISEQIVKAPFTLSFPMGWLAQSLDGSAVSPINGSTRCVEALSDASYW